MVTERAAADTVALIERYYAAFNAGDSEAMLACLAEDVVHDVNQGARRTGKAAFRAFSAHMERCYAEQLESIAIMETDEGLPPAGGQTYRLPAGAFFEVGDGLIVRVTTYYNLAAWLRQIAAKAEEPPA
jgi:ketosteroid isomerase-like protein